MTLMSEVWMYTVQCDWISLTTSGRGLAHTEMMAYHSETFSKDTPTALWMIIDLCKYLFYHACLMTTHCPFFQMSQIH